MTHIIEPGDVALVTHPHRMTDAQKEALGVLVAGLGVSRLVILEEGITLQIVRPTPDLPETPHGDEAQDA